MHVLITPEIQSIVSDHQQRGLFRSHDKPQNLGGYPFFFGGTTSGKAVNEHTAMQMTAVCSCVRILAETVAGLPLHIHKSWSYPVIAKGERFPHNVKTD